MSKLAKQITVVDYDPEWPIKFERLRRTIAEAVADTAISIEHVGGTAVPGLAAKPIIDIDVVVASLAEVPTAIQRLMPLGYVHQGNLGMEGREAFKSPEGSTAHHLYVCVKGSAALSNHLAVRDSLRSNAVAVMKYGLLKKELAVKFPNDMGSYIDGKADLLSRMLKEAGLSETALAAIAQANRKN